MTLREQVARAIIEGMPGPEGFDDILDGTGRSEWLADADAAIGVVLAAVAEQIEALRGWDASTDPRYDKISRKELLAVVARLGEADA